MTSPTSLKAYFQLTKPGIIRGNTIPAIAGFILASGRHINFVTLGYMLVGLVLIIGGACVLNNVIDRNIDKKMDRTKERALVTGRIKVLHAVVYGLILEIAGLWLLNKTTKQAMLTAMVLIISYVVLYAVFKRISVHGTLVGAIPGAMPPVIGYTAVTGQYDAAALILFLILVTWQMPHFYAIAIYRKKDYAAAGIPVLSVIKGNVVTKYYIMAYIVLFTIVATLLTVAGYTSVPYLLAPIILGLCWFNLGLKGFSAKNDDAWAKKMFGFSLLVLLVLCVAITIDALVKSVWA